MEVSPGDERIRRDPDVERAGESVLKIRGTNDCGRGVEGTGFLYARDRLMTNAHVVAGVDDPEVEVGEDNVPATVVEYDPELDIAVLEFDSGSLPLLAFNDPDSPARSKDAVAILGYPEDGPYDVRAGRIRDQQRLSSPDIYGDGKVIRDVYSVRGLVRPGNSGGPIVTSGGEAVGVVFAASVTDEDTGYALTSAQVAQAAALGVTSDSAVDTGDCAG